MLGKNNPTAAKIAIAVQFADAQSTNQSDAIAARTAELDTENNDPLAGDKRRNPNCAKIRAKAKKKDDRMENITSKGLAGLWSEARMSRHIKRNLCARDL